MHVFIGHQISRSHCDAVDQAARRASDGASESMAIDAQGYCVASLGFTAHGAADAGIELYSFGCIYDVIAGDRINRDQSHWWRYIHSQNYSRCSRGRHGAGCIAGDHADINAGINHQIVGGHRHAKDQSCIALYHGGGVVMAINSQCHGIAKLDIRAHGACHDGDGVI